MRRFSVLCTLLLFLCCLLSGTNASAAIVYDNSSGTSTNVYYSSFEYGDEIVLAGTERIVTQFMFEYYGDFVPDGTQSARLRLYQNDGADVDPRTEVVVRSPGTLLYDSGNFSIFPGYQTQRVVIPSITVPNGLTWTVQFSGMVGGNGDEAGLVFRDPPTVGRSFDDVWLKAGTNWQIFGWKGNPMANFAARIVSGVELPSVSIRRDTNKVILEWTGASILQTAPSANGPYTDLPDFRNKFEFDTRSAPVAFWRLRN